MRCSSERGCPMAHTVDVESVYTSDGEVLARELHEHVAITPAMWVLLDKHCLTSNEHSAIHYYQLNDAEADELLSGVPLETVLGHQWDRFEREFQAEEA